MPRYYLNFLYIDPGTGSMLISAIIATLSVVFFALKDRIYSLFSKKGDKGDRLDPNKHYKLVYYSEGRQYWNVFKPLLEEGVNRSIDAIYLTSDKGDPGLEANIPGLQSIYIGTGRESYFNLNRLNADMLVMTTPGLDVLEIKRSKDVKHYSHLTHATSSSGSYKAYATDYYDSVLVGGEGELELIRELEEKRKLPKKEIEVIGHTYLDVLRDKLKKESYDYSLFKEKRKTILISPTWGNHGLLTNYGEKLISALEKDNKYNIIIRPHPQSFISERELMDELMDKLPNNENRIWNMDRENLKAMSHADLMISDFSGIIFDFYTLFKKPILTMRSQYEKRGREAMDLSDDPWDLRLLDKIGGTLEEKDLDNIAKIVDNTISEYSFSGDNGKDINRIMDKYPNESAIRGMDYIEAKLKELEKSHIQESSKAKDITYYLDEDYTYNPRKGDSNRPGLAKVLRAITSPNFLLQMVMVSFMLLLYIFIGQKFLPSSGLNAKYLRALRPYAFYLSTFLILIFYLSLFFIGKRHLIYEKSFESFAKKDILLILLPLTPIVQYIFANQDILQLSDVLMLLGIFSFYSLLLIVIIPWLLSPLIAKIFTQSLSLALTIVIVNMGSFGKNSKALYITLIMIALILLSFLLTFFKKKKVLSILILVFFLANSVGSVGRMKGEAIDLNTGDLKSNVFKYTDGLEVKNYPDVFLMIYDSYANQETYESYGFDNSQQMDFLLEQGFTIYDGTYSTWYNSLSSMSKLLSIGGYPQHIRTLARKEIAGEAVGLKFFKDKGYINHLLTYSDYMTKGYQPKYDTIFPPLEKSIKSYEIIEKAIFEGEFRDDIEFSKFKYSDLLEHKKMILSENRNEPEFLYHHIDKPGHSPVTGLRENEKVIQFSRIKKANKEMMNDIKNINFEDRDVIVIIAGDHGPALTKSGWLHLNLNYKKSEIDRLDIQDRYGTFLAIHWPDKSYADKYDIRTIQDVLPAVISYMYEDDSLYEKIKTSNTIDKVGASYRISGAGVENGIIQGGMDDGKPLFENTGIRFKEDK